MLELVESRVGPRERALEEGVSALADGDLVAILLGTGTTGRPVQALACDVLEAFGGLEGLARHGPHALADHRGLGVAKAVRLAAALELGLRVQRRSARPREALTSSANVATWFRAEIGSLDHEEMWIVALDGRNGLRAARRVARGGLHGCSVTARDVLRAGLVEAASAFVLVHNHPSGDPQPSVEDIEMTRVVADAADVVGMPLVDHVVVTASGKYSSMLDLGILPG